MIDIFNLDCLNHEHIQRILKVLKTFRPDFDIPIRSSNVNNRLLNKIYQEKSTQSIQTDLWWENIDFNEKLKQQINMEIEQKGKVQSIDIPTKLDDKLV